VRGQRIGGFSLIEVLVTMLLLAIGMLGLASLQASTLRNGHSSYLRSQATIQAYDMADRIRANAQAVTAGDYDAIAGTPVDPGCLTAGCTPAEMAQYDAFEWNTTNAALLPQGAGTVAGAGAGSVFTISITWNEVEAGQAVAKVFATEFEP